MCFDKLKLEGCYVLWLLRPRKNDRRRNGHVPRIIPRTIHPRTLHPSDNSPSQLGQILPLPLKIQPENYIGPTYMNAHKHTYIPTCIAHAHTDIQIYKNYTFVHTYIHTYRYKNTHLRISLYTMCIQNYIHAYIHTYVYVCMSVYVCMLEWSKIKKFLRVALHNPPFVLCLPTITSTKF